MAEYRRKEEYKGRGDKKDVELERDTVNVGDDDLFREPDHLSDGGADTEQKASTEELAVSTEILSYGAHKAP